LFKIAETATFRRTLAELDKPERVRLSEKLRSFVYPKLRMNPVSGPNVKRLTNDHPPTWRYRIGAYRVFYEIHGTVVFITAIHRRKDAYR
jgi:mRNA interferase RelE/StbE